MGLYVSHHARISQRGGESFFLDILFNRMSTILRSLPARSVDKEAKRSPILVGEFSEAPQTFENAGARIPAVRRGGRTELELSAP